MHIFFHTLVEMLLRMKNFKNQTILITGGGSGIGKIMARLFLEREAKVVIWDINQHNIDTTLNELGGLGSIKGYRINVADIQEIENGYQLVKQNDGVVDVLINNAGIVVGKYFHEHTIEDIKRTMDINATAPMFVTRLFLQDMLAQNSGYICTIASSAGLISNPKMSVYASSKWAALGWSDSVRLEMKQLQKNIGVTTVTPYYINTGMFDGVKSTFIPILNPEKVAKKIVRSIEKGKPICSMPWSMRFVRFSQGLLPIWLFDWFVGGVLGIYKTMEDFKGRK